MCVIHTFAYRHSPSSASTPPTLFEPKRQGKTSNKTFSCLICMNYLSHFFITMVLFSFLPLVSGAVDKYCHETGRKACVMWQCKSCQSWRASWVHKSSLHRSLNSKLIFLLEIWTKLLNTRLHSKAQAHRALLRCQNKRKSANYCRNLWTSPEKIPFGLFRRIFSENEGSPH